LILGGAAILGLLSFNQPAKAEPQSVYAPGDVVVTGFSGIKPVNENPAGSDDFFIDVENGVSMKIFKPDLQGEPQAQLLETQPSFTVPTAEVGQVLPSRLKTMANLNRFPTSFWGRHRSMG
jgi:hypothetical protein